MAMVPQGFGAGVGVVEDLIEQNVGIEEAQTVAFSFLDISKRTNLN